MVNAAQNSANDLDLLKPKNMKNKEWETFLKDRNSKSFKEKSEFFFQMRAKQTLHHTMSRQGYARLEDKMKKESGESSTICRVDVWRRGHTKHNGQPCNEAVEQTLKYIDDYPPELKSTDVIENDAITKTLGKETKGRVRGMRFGATPSAVYSQMQQSENTNRLEDRIQSIEREMEELKTLCMQERGLQHPGSVQSETGSAVGGVQDPKVQEPHGVTPQSQKGSVHGQNPAENSKCKLLHWSGSGDVVAEGRIASTDPLSRVHHSILGPTCWKVWVERVLVHDVMLIRPTEELSTLDDAIGSTVAWSIACIALHD